MKKNRLFLLIFLLLTQLGVSQQYHFDHLELEEGINYNLTKSILQDKDGFMWFGTLYGLIKFDGHTYSRFNHTPYDSLSISADDIICLYQDKKGYIWIGTYSAGLNRLNPNTKKITQFKYSDLDTNSISDNRVYAISEDANGNIWVGTSNGLNRFIPNSTRGYFKRYYTHSQTGNQLKSNDIRALFLDSRKLLWIGTNQGGLSYYNAAHNQFSYLIESKKTNIYEIYEDRDRQLWLATWGDGLKQLNGFINGNQFIISAIESYRHNPYNPKTISSDKIWCIEQDNAGKLWIGTYNGLNVLQPGKTSFQRIYHQEKNANSLTSNKIADIKFDRSGVLWVSTFNGGIDRIVPAVTQFEHFVHNPFDPRSLIDKQVTALLQDKSGKIWVGSPKGITQIKKNNSGSDYNRFLFKARNPYSTIDNNITALIEDSDEQVWVGTHNGLKRVKKDGSIEQFNLPAAPFGNEQDNIVTALLAEGDNGLWVGTIIHGLCYFDKKSQQFTRFMSNEFIPNALSSNYILTLYRDRTNTIWVGTYRGLNRMEQDAALPFPDNISFTTKFKSRMGEKEVSEKVFTLFEDKENNLWIGTGNGLITFNKQNSTFKFYTEENTLYNNVICGILNDEKENLWISSHNGLIKYNPRDTSFTHFSTINGIQSNTFTTGAYFKGKDGKMMFGGNNGFNLFIPEEIAKSAYRPPVVLTSVLVMGEEISKNIPAHTLETLNLNYDENFITLRFSALDYKMPERNIYAYYLENYDRDWVFNESKNQVQYSNLNPGVYTFKVRGANSSGVWNTSSRALKIIINPPFWETWWFKIIIAIVIILILLTVFYTIRRNAIQKMEINKQIAQLRLKALRAQMNPHFIFNTINSIQYFISCNDQKSAFSYLSKFSKLMRQTLDNSAHSRIPIERELEALQLYMDLQKLRFENGFTYHIEVDPNIDIYSYEVPTMLIQPYIENAINHGLPQLKDTGHVLVSLKKRDEIIECIIDDNGIGITRSMQLKKQKSTNHISSGMRLTRERLKIINDQHNNDFYIKIEDKSTLSGSLSGTRVTINIPMQ